MNDVIVIGSGASAVHAAWPLVEAGLKVMMLDMGRTETKYANLIPDKSFEEIRLGDPEQHRYFLGDNFEGIPFGDVRVGAQLTPPRQYLTTAAGMVLGAQFQAMESCALGGLAAGWGAATPPFLDEDMHGWPINAGHLLDHYRRVGLRIGVSGRNDDLAEFLGDADYLQPPTRPDDNARYLYRRYLDKRAALNRRGFHAGAPRLAILTKAHANRQACRYLDMEFWADKDQSVYRPRYTVDELKRYANFEYRNGWIVERFSEDTDGVRVAARRHEAREEQQEFRASRIVIAAGNIGTARIVLQSLDLYDMPVPILSNPYTYFPCLVWGRLGQATSDRRHSLTQLMAYHRPADGGPLVQAQTYSYRSLLTFKLVKESPLPRPESIALMRLLQPYFVIVGIHHEDRPTESKRLLLPSRWRGAPESRMRIEYNRGKNEESGRLSVERELMACFRMLKCQPIKRIDPGNGSSIHYGGSLPMSNEEKTLTTRTNGQLRGATNVYIADGSVFPHLPAKGLTFTMMANADRIGTMLAREMKRR